MKKTILVFVAGLGLGGLFGGIGGYVINDLTSKQNPEVVQQMQEEEALQEDLDDFLNQLPAPTSTENSHPTGPQ